MMIAAERVAMAEHITASKAREDLRGTLNRVVRGRERLVITRHNDEEVAVIPVEDLRLLESLERQMEDAIGSEAARRVLSAPDEGRGSWDDVREDLGLQGMAYRVDLSTAAAKELGKLKKRIQPRIMKSIGERISALVENPRPPSVEKVEGHNNL